MTRFSTPLKNTLIGAVIVGAAFTAPYSAQAGDYTNTNNWVRGAETIVQQNMQYPRMAEIKGQSGTAIVRVTIGHDGNVQDYDIVQSTGSHLLDRAAARTMDGIEAFPATNFTSNSETTFNLSLNYLFANSWSEEVAINRSLENKGYVRAERVAGLSGYPMLASIEFVPSEEG